MILFIILCYFSIIYHHFFNNFYDNTSKNELVPPLLSRYFCIIKQ